MARPHGRSSEEEALLERAMRVLPGGVLGGYRPITDYRATLGADREAHAAFTRDLLQRGVVKAAQKFYVSLAHGEREIEETLAAFTGALGVVAEREQPRPAPSS